MANQTILISEKTVKKLPPAQDAAGYIARDTAIPGFHVKVV